MRAMLAHRHSMCWRIIPDEALGVVRLVHWPFLPVVSKPFMSLDILKLVKSKIGGIARGTPEIPIKRAAHAIKRDEARAICAPTAPRVTECCASKGPLLSTPEWQSYSPYGRHTACWQP